MRISRALPGGSFAGFIPEILGRTLDIGLEREKPGLD